ncbi:serine protease, ClpP class [Thalassovita litoralis]|uniref:Serine protease, ClpP class n=1 Tax=Thalassovita litoralis TaxID=1010611 RepID=A0A521FRX5_9RHOB|nr:S49 family peptidase [Thalassovita litoralis]SMO98958.1 serine protease, ClpP class [Thalassovita litoralis]
MMLVDRSSRIWALRQDEMMIADAISQRGQLREAAAVSEGERLKGSDFARVHAGVAVIPVRGMLMRQMSWWFWSYQEIMRDIQLAQESRLVSSIVLDVDSPGGLVAGCADCAAFIAESGPKPIEAFVGGLCASAAYWLSSAADRIVLGSGSTVGSIGAVIEYVDLEPMFEKMGARIVRVVSGDSPNKRLDPDSEAGRAEMQALVDASCGEFVASVASGRGVTDAEVLERFGQGLVFDADAAISRGMADARGTLNSLVAEMADRDAVQADTAPAAQETQEMNWEDISAAQLREHRADIVSEIEASATAGADQQIQQAVEAERARIAAIDEIAVDGHDELVARARATGWAAEKLALEIVKADKASGSHYLASRQDGDAGAAVAPADPAPATSQTGSIEDQAKASWDKDADLRAEFSGNYNAYLAFMKAQDSGQARIYSRA